MINQVINEIFRQMTITLTLPLDVPVRPMDEKGLIVMIYFILFYYDYLKLSAGRAQV